MPLVGLGRRDEELHLHLLELADAEEEVAGRDLVAEALSDLRDPERRLDAQRRRHVLEVHEDPLCRLRPQVGHAGVVAHRTDMRLEHQVEVPRLGQVALRVLAGTLRGALAAVARGEVVGTEPQLAGAAVDHRVGEACDVARCDPDLRVHDHRGVERDHVVALLDHRALPLALDVLVQQDPVVAEVEGRAETAVDVRGREHERAPSAQRRDLLDRGGSFEFLEHRLKLAEVGWRCCYGCALSTSAAISTNSIRGRTPYRPVTCSASSSVKNDLAAAFRVPDVDVHRSPVCFVGREDLQPELRHALERRTGLLRDTEHPLAVEVAVVVETHDHTDHRSS